jgi:hypothetical protein
MYHQTIYNNLYIQLIIICIMQCMTLGGGVGNSSLASFTAQCFISSIFEEFSDARHWSCDLGVSKMKSGLVKKLVLMSKKLFCIAGVSQKFWQALESGQNRASNVALVLALLHQHLEGPEAAGGFEEEDSGAAGSGHPESSSITNRVVKVEAQT